MRNRAFAFLKPHAMSSQAVVNAIADRFAEAGVVVAHKERLPAAGLAGLYDRHVGPAARAALAPDPAKLFDEAARARFADAFGEPFAAVAAAGRLLTPFAALDRLVLDPDGLLRAWGARGAEDFGGGVYVAALEPEGLRHEHHHHGHGCDCGHDHGESVLYVVNGFYPAERAPYADETGPGVLAMQLEFDLPWRDFNDVVIGDENPGGALEESIRGYLFDRREALAMRIDPFDNILHASRSPFDALCETLVWLGASAAASDPLLALLGAPAPDAAALLRLRDAGALAPLVAGLDTPDAASLVTAALTDGS